MPRRRRRRQTDTVSEPKYIQPKKKYNQDTFEQKYNDIYFRFNTHNRWTTVRYHLTTTYNRICASPRDARGIPLILAGGRRLMLLCRHHPSLIRCDSAGWGVGGIHVCECARLQQLCSVSGVLYVRHGSLNNKIHGYGSACVCVRMVAYNSSRAHTRTSRRRWRTAGGRDGRQTTGAERR